MARQSMTPRQAEWRRFEDGWTATNPVPGWVYMADCPPTDEEPYDICEDLGGLPDEQRGTWLGCLLIILAFATGVGVGMLLR